MAEVTHGRREPLYFDRPARRKARGRNAHLRRFRCHFQQGQSPEEIQRTFPALTLEQVYGVITYYLGHQSEIDQYLRQQKQIWDNARADAEGKPNAAVQRLRQLRTDKAGQPQ